MPISSGASASMLASVQCLPATARARRRSVTMTGEPSLRWKRMGKLTSLRVPSRVPVDRAMRKSSSRVATGSTSRGSTW